MSSSVDRLKELLFEPESAAIRDLRARIEQATVLAARERQDLAQYLERLIAATQSQDAAERARLEAKIDAGFARTVESDRLADSVASVLVEATRKAELVEHDRMSRAMAPLVVKTVHTELANNRDAMVEALYPITGRLVKAYVASAMKDLMDQINRRLENNAVMLRLRSLTTRRSVAELALADSQRLMVDELFLIERGSGALVLHWPPSPSTTERDVRLSGVLTAINDFASHTLGDRAGNLRSFDLDGFTLYLRGSARHLLAAKCHGTPPPGIETLIDEKFIDMVELLNRWDGTPTSGGNVSAESLLGPFATALDETLEARHQTIVEAIPRSNPLKTVAAVIALPLLAWMGWSAWSAYQVDTTRRSVEEAIAGHPELIGYPLTTRVSAQGRIVSLSGLTPSAATRRKLIDDIRQRLPEASLLDRLSVVAGADNDASTAIASVRQDIAALGQRMASAQVRRRVETVRRRLADVIGEITQIEAATSDDRVRTIARTTRSKTVRASNALGSWLDQTEPASAGAGRAVTDSASLATVATDLTTATRDLMAVLEPVDGRRPAPPAATGPSVGPVAADVEDLVIASERLHATVFAVAGWLKVVPKPASARERLAELARRTAVFFSEGSEFRTPDTTAAALAEMARLVRDSGVGIRVVGFTDDIGSSARNSPLAIARAERVVAALVERGAPRDLLVAVGRTGSHDIASTVGAQSNNRRVEFEVTFDGELEGRR
jgi:outer membrane protein OmpA-like peptidoglycan-associated protein